MTRFFAALSLAFGSLATLATATHYSPEFVLDSRSPFPEVGLTDDVVPITNLKIASSKHQDGKIRYIEDSGVCETTKGVKTFSGYLDIGKNMSMFFWMFEARKNPEKAPFALWLNGGPGCSSMIGLFQEHGPCKVDEAGNSTSLNPYSWNELANMIYIDQPISTGFSYGNDPVNTTWQASPFIWKFFQIFFSSKEFSKYQSREFAFATESYGGHYGPAFSQYFQEQNAKIASGELKGEKVNLKTLLINNGWYDPLIQNIAYYEYAQEKYNHHFDLVNKTTLAQVKKAVYGPGGCVELEKQCYKTGDKESCRNADDYCINNVFVPALGDRNSYDILGNSSDPFPSESYIKYLNNPKIQKAIGAETKYSECSDASGNQFVPSGDDARSTIPNLVKVLESGLPVLIWAGDLDYNCNQLGGYNSMLNMDWSGKEEFSKAEWEKLEYQGTIWGVYKTAKNLTYLKIFDAGHEVPAYKPEISLEIFRQRLALQPLHST